MAFWAAGVSRFGGEIAGDRPPRYVPRDVFRLDRTLAGDRPPRYGNRGVFRSGIKVCKTLMSIAPCDTMNLRAFRSLMCRCSFGCRWIKVLADLENGVDLFSIDMQVLKDLKRHPLQKKCSLRGR